MFRFLILAVVLVPLACSSAEESDSAGVAGEPAAEVAGVAGEPAAEVSRETLGPVAGAAYDSPSAEAHDGEVAPTQDAVAAAAGEEDASAAEDDASTIE